MNRGGSLVGANASKRGVAQPAVGGPFREADLSYKLWPGRYEVPHEPVELQVTLTIGCQSRSRQRLWKDQKRATAAG
jgi:hypothetical protein